MSNTLAWVEFNSPVYVGNAGYVDRIYTACGSQGGPTDIVCAEHSFKDAAVTFNFRDDEEVSVPFANVKYTYSVRTKDLTLPKPAIAEPDAPRKRGRPPKLPPVAE